MHSYARALDPSIWQGLKMHDTSERELRSALKTYLNETGTKPTPWAQRAEVSVNSLRQFLDGTTKTMRFDILWKLARAQQMSVAELISTERRRPLQQPDYLPTKVPDQLVEIKALPLAAGAGFGDNPEDWEHDTTFKYITADLLTDIGRAPDALLSLSVRGQSMSPILESGDMIIVDMEDKNVGNEGLFTAWDGEAMVTKWIERIPGSDPMMLRFKSYNEMSTDYAMPAEQCNIIGRVVWFARKL